VSWLAVVYISSWSASAASLSTVIVVYRSNYLPHAIYAFRALLDSLWLYIYVLNVLQADINSNQSGAGCLICLPLFRRGEETVPIVLQ